MNSQVVCKKCGMTFEAADLENDRPIQCPGCMSTIEKIDLPTAVEVGGYQVFELLGQGGMGQVYRATSKDGKQVALKVMSQELVESEELTERFRREMKIMASLSHENIVGVIDQGETTDFTFFVMELIEGDNLRNIMRKGPLEERRVMDISIQVLRALGYAHSKGIIHRDIKPENIMFDKNGVVKVTDFGLARKAQYGSDQQSITAANAFLGTESYMSPEQKINPKSVTHKSDIYSYGVVLYEMLTGGNLPMGLFQPPSCHRHVNEYWDSFIYRLLDINPEMRPKNCQEIIDELENLGKEESDARASIPKKGEKKKGVIEKINDGDDLIYRENVRIEEECQKMVGEALDFSQAGDFEKALPLWERALATASTEDSRTNIAQWINVCKEKIAEKLVAQQITFLCPHCRKTFNKPADEELPSEFPCPKCNGKLKFDKGQKRIFPIKEAKGYEPPPLQNRASDPNPGSSSRIRPKSTLFGAMWNNTLFFVGILFVIDVTNPGLLNHAVDWLDLTVFKKQIPLGSVAFAENIRMLLVVLLLFFSANSLYRGFQFYNSGHRSDN